MTSLFFGSKKKEEKPKDPKDVRKDAPPAGKDVAPNQALNQVKVSAKDSLKEVPKDKKEKAEKKEKKEKEKDKHKPHEEEMPDEATLNSLFMALLDSLEFAEKEREAMMKQSKETKWMYIKNQKASQSTGNVNETPAYFCSSLQASPSAELLHSLRLVVQSKPIAWIKQFRDLEGIRHLTHYMSVLDKKGVKCTPEEVESTAECVRIMKALMNNKVGLEGLLNTNHSIRPLCGALHHQDVQVVRTVHQLLLVVLIHGQDGYKLLVDALQHYGQMHAQKRFQILIESFTKASHPLEAQAVLFSIISRIITTPTDIDFRISLSTEFNRLGLKELIEKLKTQPNFDGSDLDTLIDEYEEDMKSDIEDLQNRFRDLNVDFSDAMKLAERLNAQLSPTPAHSSFLGVLRELLGVPGTTDAGLKAWILIERLITQISLQKSVLHIDGDNAVVLADLFASVEAAAKQQTGNKKVEELEKLVAKLEKFESQREAEIRQKDLIINELKTQLGDVAQVAQMKAALDAAQREVTQLKKEAEEAAAHIKVLEQRPAHTLGEHSNAGSSGAAPAAAAASGGGEHTAAPTGAPPPPMPPKMPPPPKGLKLKPKPAAVVPAESISTEEKPADAMAPAATTDTPAPTDGGEAAAVVTGGPPPPPLPKLKGGPLPPPPPKLKAKGAPQSTATPTDGATPESAAATSTEGEAASAAPTGGPPPPPPMKGGPPPPPMKGGPPPPPMKGGPPPPPGKGAGPPPPPGGKGAAVVAAAPAAPPIPPKKRPPPPTVKMKGITWNKVPPNKLAQTVWAKTSDFEVPIDQKNLEDLFGAAVVETKKADDGAKKKKKDPVSLIDGKRSQNLNILLGSKLGKLTFDDIKKAILTLDDTVLVPEVTKALLGFVPTDEEITQITEFIKEQEAKPDPEDRLPLAKADTFLFEMHKLPHLQERLASLLYKQNFSVKLEEIRPDIRSIKIACQELRRSDKMVKLLELILYLGNFLNAGTFRGNMDGVKVDMLPKLVDTKTNSKDMPTFLHFLVVFVAEKFSDLSKWPEDISYSPAASKVSLPTSEAEIAGLKKGLGALESALAKVDQFNEMDAFKRVMAEFAAKAKTEFGELEALLKETQESFLDVLMYFGEDPKTSPEDFFRVWSTFSTLWEKAKEDNKKAEEQREKLKKREEQEKKKKEAAAAKGEKKGAGGLVDDLMSNLGKVNRRPTQRVPHSAQPEGDEADDHAQPTAVGAPAAAPASGEKKDGAEPPKGDETKPPSLEAKFTLGGARSASPQRVRSSVDGRSVSPQRIPAGDAAAVPPPMVSPRGLAPRIVLPVVGEGGAAVPPPLSPRSRAAADGTGGAAPPTAIPAQVISIGSRNSSGGEPKPLPAKPKAAAKQGSDVADEAVALFAALKKPGAVKKAAPKPAAPDIADEAVALFAALKKPAVGKKPAAGAQRLSAQGEAVAAPPPAETATPGAPASAAPAPTTSPRGAEAKPPAQEPQAAV